MRGPIIKLGGWKKGMNKAAYSGQLNCPVCYSKSIRYLENIGPYRIRYRCRKCGMAFQYETGKDNTHPYAPFANKSKFRNIVEMQAIRDPKHLPGRKP